MEFFCIALILILIGTFSGLFVLWHKYRVLLKQLGSFNDIIHKYEVTEARLNTAAAELLELETNIKERLEERRRLDEATNLAKIEH